MHTSYTLTLGERLWTAVAAIVVLCFWIGAQPFRDLTTADIPDGLMQQMLLLFTIALAVSVQFFKWSGPWPGIGAIAILCLWLLWSSLMAEDSGAAVRNSFVQFLIICGAYLALKLPKNEVEFAKVIGGTILFSLLLSYAGVLLLPQLAVHQASDVSETIHAGLWRGHFIHKNAASAAMAVAVFCALYLHGLGFRRLAYVLGIGGAFFLLHTGGKTGLLTLPAIIFAVWAIERWPVLRWPIVIGGILAFNAIVLTASVSWQFADFLNALGIDATFTSRVDIWRIVLDRIPDIFGFGVGLNTYWGSDANLHGGWEIEGWAYTAGSAHNGYMDLIFNIGLPGFLISIYLFVILPLINIGRIQRTGNSRALSRFFMQVWLFGLVNACLESVFFSRPGAIWFVFLVACFGLHFQARASLDSATHPLEERATA